jgi:hypothetical protein
MANYTKSRIVASKAAGTHASGAIGVMTLTPDDGYVIKAGDFSVADVSGFDFALADTSTAYAIGNTVTITVSYDGVTVSDDVTLTLAITGDAILFEPTVDVVCNLSIDEANLFTKNSLDITSHASKASGITCGSATTITGTHVTTRSLIANRKHILVAEFNIVPVNTLLSTDGSTVVEKLSGVVGLKMLDGSDSYIFKVKSLTSETNSGSVNFGTSTVQVVEVYRKVDDAHSEVKFAEPITDKAEVNDRAITVVPPAINKTIDLFDTDGPFTIAIGGETRNFKIYGDVGAGAALQVGGADINFTIPSTDIVDSSGALVASNRARGKGVFEKTVIFPATTANQSITVKVHTPVSGTTIVGDQDHVFSQSVNSTLTITCDNPTGSNFKFSKDGNTYASSPVALASNGVANKRGRQLVNLKEKTSRITYNQVFICGTGAGGADGNASSIPTILHQPNGDLGIRTAVVGADPSGGIGGKHFRTLLDGNNIRKFPIFSSTSDADTVSSFDNSDSPNGHVIELVDVEYSLFAISNMTGANFTGNDQAGSRWVKQRTGDDSANSSLDAIKRIDVTCIFNIRQYGNANATITLKTDRLFVEENDA